MIPATPPDSDLIPISDVLNHLQNRTAQLDGVVVTGGLGPTTDDMTTAAIAKAYGLGLKTDEAVLARIRELFAKRRAELNARGGNTEDAMFDD